MPLQAQRLKRPPFLRVLLQQSRGPLKLSTQTTYLYSDFVHSFWVQSRRKYTLIDSTTAPLFSQA